MPSGRRGQIKHVYVRRRASTSVDARRRALTRVSTDVDARDARRATDVDGRRRARCEWAFSSQLLFIVLYSAKVFKRMRARRRRYSRQDGQPKGDGPTENKISLDDV